MTNRKHSATSKAAHESIKPAKSFYHEKIVEGLMKLKCGGTFAEIGDSVGIGHDKIWKRLSELSQAGTIFNTGVTRPLPSGRSGSVWQLTSIKTADKIISDATNNSQQQKLF